MDSKSLLRSLSAIKTGKFWKELIIMIVGMMITAAAINPFRMVIIGLIGTWINGLVVDYFTASLSKRKRVSIISNEHERIREERNNLR